MLCQKFTLVMLGSGGGGGCVGSGGGGGCVGGAGAWGGAAGGSGVAAGAHADSSRPLISIIANTKRNDFFMLLSSS